MLSGSTSTWSVLNILQQILSLCFDKAGLINLIDGRRCRDTFNDWAKPYLPLKEWADQYRYVINVAGNCASARLSKQLLSDAAVFLVGGEDEEWCALN